MGYLMNAMRCFAIILSMASALALLGCATTETKSSRIGEMSKFDIATASPEEIAQSLEKDGKVVQDSATGSGPGGTAGATPGRAAPRRPTG